MTTPTQRPPTTTGGLGLPPLLEEPPAPAAPPKRPPRPPLRDRLRAALQRRLAPESRKRTIRAAIAAGAALAILAGSTGAYLLWPRRVPDYLNDPMDQVLDFTLLTDEFNRLPLEKRLELVRDLIQRLKNASAEDSVLMAAFAASIRDKARKQLEENGQRLAIDMLDSYAAGYNHIPPQDRAAYLDEKILEFTRLMEDLSGEKSGLSDDPDERLAQIKRQAKRDQQRMSERNSDPMEPGRVFGFIGFLRDGPDRLVSPVQEARMTRFTRDMVRHLRGQDVATGKPRGPG